jgi:hypothetical protein
MEAFDLPFLARLVAAEMVTSIERVRPSVRRDSEDPGAPKT